MTVGKSLPVRLVCLTCCFVALMLSLIRAGDQNPSPEAADHPVLPEPGEEVSLERVRTICDHYGLHALWLKIERDPPIQPFKSDGCTGWFDEWKGVSLYPAGVVHDLKYWAGYPGEDVERLVADAELMIDVARLLGSTEMAETMFHGVRIGGTEKLSASFSWGFGRRMEVAGSRATRAKQGIPDAEASP